jgi:hypothetical protein
MADTRKKNTNWSIKTNSDGTTPTDDAHLAVLMDIRDELQQLNRLLHCRNFTGMPHELRQLNRRMAVRYKLPKGRTKS